MKLKSAKTWIYHLNKSYEHCCLWKTETKNCI